MPDNNDADAEITAPVAPPPDALAAVLNLLALATAPDAVAARLEKLQAAERHVTAAVAALDAARTEHDRAIAAERSVIEAEREQARKLMASVREQESCLAASARAFAEAHPEWAAEEAERIEAEQLAQNGRYATFGEGSTLVREFRSGAERAMIELGDTRGGTGPEEIDEQNNLPPPPPYTPPPPHGRRRTRDQGVFRA